MCGAKEVVINDQIVSNSSNNK